MRECTQQSVEVNQTVMQPVLQHASIHGAYSVYHSKKGEMACIRGTHFPLTRQLMQAQTC